MEKTHADKKAEEKLDKNDPDYFSKIRARRKTYPKHEGQFTAKTASKAGSKGGTKSKRSKGRRYT